MKLQQFTYLLLLGLLIMATVACSNADNEGPVDFRTFQIDQLLTEGDIKIWDLTERSINGEQQVLTECELDDFLQFDRNILTESDSNTLFMLAGELACTDTVPAYLRGEWLAVEGETPGLAEPVADTLEWYLYRLDNDTVLTPFTDTVQVFLEEISGQFLTIQYEEPLTDSTSQLIRASYMARDF